LDRRALGAKRQLTFSIALALNLINDALLLMVFRLYELLDLGDITHRSKVVLELSLVLAKL
jgi:hypothetical protein